MSTAKHAMKPFVESNNTSYNPTAVAGGTCSLLALGGWLLLAHLLWGEQTPQGNGPPPDPITVVLGIFEVMATALVGLVGIGVTGTLAVVGTTLSLFSLAFEPRRHAWVAIAVSFVAVLPIMGLIVMLARV